MWGSGRPSRRLRRRLVPALVAGLLAFGMTPAPARASAPLSVIVQATDPLTAARAVSAVGGRITLTLPIINGAAAVVPARALAPLRARPGVRAVTPNDTVRFAEAESGNTSKIQSVHARETNAESLWASGTTGAGVRVALIDTGIADVADLAHRVVDVPDPVDRNRGTVRCVDFSGEGHCGDSYGHGTFVAGLIAGNGAASAGRFKGAAPQAELVSIKIAGRDGSADVSKVLAAIQWVVSFAPELRIRVLNLSLGTNSRVSYRIDPLNFAVERAWRAGIAVVVSAGNLGPGAGTISKPADDPLVITVGAVDDRETPAVSDDRLPRFSSRGPTVADGLAKPDVVAPGGRVISLRSPGSTVEELVPGRGIDGTYRRGSGTSMSAGIVSGIAALVLQEHPGWTPDRVKFAMMATARKVAERDPLRIGAGLVDAFAASRSAPDGLANTGVRVLSDGSGSLEGSRGDVRVSRECTTLERAVDPGCDHIRGEETAQRMAFDSAEYVKSEWNGSSWYSSQWNGMLGSSWYGSSWYGSSWYGSSWYGSSWYGSSWYGEEESRTSYGLPIPGSSWYGAWS